MLGPEETAATAVAHAHAKRAAGAVRRAVTELALAREQAAVLAVEHVDSSAHAGGLGAFVGLLTDRHGPVTVVVVRRDLAAPNPPRPIGQETTTP